MPEPKHPLQHICIDPTGVFRFQTNEIVRFLLDAGPHNLNTIAAMRQFSDEDREQFAQLIGYSLNGFYELSYASDETVERVYLVAEQLAADKAG